MKKRIFLESFITFKQQELFFFIFEICIQSKSKSTLTIPNQVKCIFLNVIMFIFSLLMGCRIKIPHTNDMKAKEGQL